MKNKLELLNICKSYNEKKILDQLTFNIEPNTIFGLMGPNGAGKTTLLRLITQINWPDSGKLLFEGTPLHKKHIKRVGYMPEERGLYKNMKVGEQLMYLAKLHGIAPLEARERINKWLERMGMTESKKKTIGQLSKGMSQKIQFIATILHEPDLLILDEPFSGLDPVSADLLETQIKYIKQQGTTIILSTHRMEQIEHFCDHILMINEGKKVVSGPIETIKKTFKEGLFRVKCSIPIPYDIQSKYDIQLQEDHYIVKFRKNEQTSFLYDLLDHHIQPILFEEILPSLRSIFMALINKINKKPQPVLVKV